MSPKILGKFPGVQISVAASGFHVRDTNHKDIEDEIDVDGDDEDIFGRPQFTEVDILSASRSASSSGVSGPKLEIEGAPIPLPKDPKPVSPPHHPRHIVLMTISRNRLLPRRPAGSASTRTQNLPSPLNVGTRAVGHVGYVA